MANFPPLQPATNAAKQVIYLAGWDLAVLGGERMPGKSRVLKGGVKLKVDHKNKAGTDGAQPTFHGIQPQEMELEVTVWNDAQLAALATVCRKFAPKAGANSAPVALDSPWVRHLGDVVNVKVLGVGELRPGERIAERKVSFYLLHWLLPTGAGKKATSTPVKAARNIASDHATNRNPPNPPPTKQPGICGPTW